MKRKRLVLPSHSFFALKIPFKVLFMQTTRVASFTPFPTCSQKTILALNNPGNTLHLSNIIGIIHFLNQPRLSNRTYCTCFKHYWVFSTFQGPP